jgi:filamin
MQENVFTRWVNMELAKRDMKVQKLKTDFRDGFTFIMMYFNSSFFCIVGVALCNLVEILSEKKVGRFNRNPRNQMQKIENIHLALTLIQRSGVRLVNVGTGDIADGNVRIILGLVWILIRRYKIIAPQKQQVVTKHTLILPQMQTATPVQLEEGITNEVLASSASDHQQGTDDLLTWCQSMLPEFGIRNLTTSWNDGRALCGLVDKLRPGAIPDAVSKDSQQALANAELGLRLATSLLGVSALILPEELTHPKVDKLAMMTYLSQFLTIPVESPNAEAFEEQSISRRLVAPPELFLAPSPEPVAPPTPLAELCYAAGPGLSEGIVDEVKIK